MMCKSLAANVVIDAMRRQQRAASTSAKAGEPTRGMNMAALTSTSIAVGSIAWYYHMYGPKAHALTPAEEGWVGSLFPGLS